MGKSEFIYVVVTDVAGEYASASTRNFNLIIQLNQMGFKLDEYHQFRLKISDENHRISLINQFIDLGALFSAGKDWSPEEVVLYYRELGKIDREFKVISWRKESEYLIYVR